MKLMPSSQKQNFHFKILRKGSPEKILEELMILSKRIENYKANF